MYNLLKFLHVLSVVAWAGGTITLLLLNSRLSKAADSAATTGVFMQGRFFSMAVFMPAAIVVLVTGLGMVMTGPWSFSLPWVSAGFTLFFLSLIFGGMLSGGTARKIAAGQGDSVVLRRRLLLYARINVLILVAAIFVMVVKP